MAEWECQALADEAKYGAFADLGADQGAEQESKPRKVVYNSSDEVWDFRADISLPWLSRTAEGKNASAVDKSSVGDMFSTGTNITTNKSSDLMLSSSLISRSNENSAFKMRNFENDFV